MSDGTRSVTSYKSAEKFPFEFDICAALNRPESLLSSCGTVIVRVGLKYAAYSYDGMTGALNTIQSYLDIPVDHYVELNMKGLEQLSNAIGPVQVDNDLEFTSLGKHFSKGTVTIDSSNILAYTRMRHEDARGDYGRQMRQRLVVQAMVEKIASLGSVLKYQKILNAISSNMKTDLTFDDVKEIATGYSGAKNIKQVQLQGKGDMIDGVSYEVVSQSELQSVQKTLKDALNVK